MENEIIYDDLIELVKVKAAEMNKLTVSDDRESAHYEADMILREVLSEVCDVVPVEARQHIEAILEAYDRIGKWYA